MPVLKHYVVVFLKDTLRLFPSMLRRRVQMPVLHRHVPQYIRIRKFIFIAQAKKQSQTRKYTKQMMYNIS